MRTEDGASWPCRIKGKLRLINDRVTNPIAVGDWVEFEPEKKSENGTISTVLPRRNYVIRSSPRKRHQLHLLACNVDQVFIVATLKEPELKPGFIDRFLLTTEAYDIPIHLVINKADMYSKEYMKLYEAIQEIYEPLGYPMHLVSAHTGAGLDVLRELLKDKTTVTNGRSGVGKSSLLNALQPQLDLQTQEISDYSGKGLHTTTFAEMYELDFGGKLIDTPGIKELGFINLSPQDVSHNFREFFSASPRCRFHDCLHLNEPDCAVKEAVDNGEISSVRYTSYHYIMEEVRAQNSWERKLDW